MKIPRYWARGTIDPQTGQSLTPGDPAGFEAVGWSDTNHASAMADATNRAKSIVRRLATHESIEPASTYWYPHRPLREQIIEEAPAGQWIMTRNSYGALILNTSQIIFADIDMPIPRWGWLGRFLMRYKPPAEEAFIQRTRQVLETMPQLGGRLYRTAAGMRLMVTSDTAAPKDEFAQNLLQALGADEQYARLCYVQESFRARLTPKYWRCTGVSRPPHPFPFANESQAREYDTWLNTYDQACQSHGVCRLIEHIGNPAIDPEIQPVVQLHDHHTMARPEAPLA